MGMMEVLTGNDGKGSGDPIRDLIVRVAEAEVTFVWG